jgi:thermostable 8-oxoguanine DNA glycosylase
MIDPTRITDFNQTKEQLEEFLLFWICAAGKNAKSAAKGLDSLMTELHYKTGLDWAPFAAIREYGKRKLPAALKRNGIGCYNQKARTFWELANSGFNLKTCSAADLETIPGIGMKTSRCFIIHSRKEADCAGLDVHILRYLRDQGYEVPKQTPTKKEYLRIEQIFIDLARKANRPIAEFDLAIWNQYSGNVA